MYWKNILGVVQNKRTWCNLSKISMENEEENQPISEEIVLQFLDSTDNYITLMESLSSSLRQGWLELASARLSMGTSRVTSTLFDLNMHPAVTTLQVAPLDGESLSQDIMGRQSRFSLRKWASFNEERCSKDTEASEDLQMESNQQLHRHGSHHISANRSHASLSEEPAEARLASSESLTTIDEQVNKERSKSLSVFGTLVSPKLRAAQLSFETAMETLVEIANMRSLMLSAYAQIQQDKDKTQ
ncbi:hypothetical protein GIB67_030049 [Kingdonia uniflora]|uniref:Vacuolar ATPase assembly protein VMA22 n=1 Tax=Kingdonia uniflora TaxID=39325 RepID=A0A7J7MXX6_9MAGN|nr:hypothetical protein GIB67_030049 [Kingdonia uniflora]